jgi:hypothetical protein
MSEEPNDTKVTPEDDSIQFEESSRYKDAILDVLNAGVELIERGAERFVDARKHFGISILKLRDDPIYFAYDLGFHAKGALLDLTRKFLRR